MRATTNFCIIFRKIAIHQAIGLNSNKLWAKIQEQQYHRQQGGKNARIYITNMHSSFSIYVIYTTMFNNRSFLWSNYGSRVFHGTEVELNTIILHILHTPTNYSNAEMNQYKSGY